MSKLVCVIHHCRHPYNDTGGFDPPPDDNNLNLVNKNNWDVPFNDVITYVCDTGMHIENDEVDPTKTEYNVTCTDVIGEYNTPMVQGSLWPNCTQTVICGDPLEPPVNGSRTWLYGEPEPQQTYNTSIRYHCKDGSQFDTDGDGTVGDVRSVDIRCQWKKLWHPYHDALPECKVTECVEPFMIPDWSNIEELTSVWTPVNTYKQYRCKGFQGTTPTRYWESDRTKSTFQIFCKPDGYYTWEDWPTCLEGELLNIPGLLKATFV